jgi:hypothetical protein
MTAVWLGAKGTWTSGDFKIVCHGVALPAIGNWLGLKLFVRINDMLFRKVVLALLFGSGAALMFLSS